MAKAKTAKRVALALPIGVPHIERVVHGILRYANQHGNWRIITSPDALAFPVRSLRRWSGDGAIVRIGTTADARAAAELDLPIVTSSGALQNPGVPRVTSDNRLVGRMAADHLLQCGFQRFAYYGARGLWYSRQRGTGFVETVEAAGGSCCSFDGLNSFNPRCDWDQMYEELQRWLDSLKPPVGLFACSDYRARMVLETCTLLGLRVPDDVAVVGVNNDEIACEFCDPPLTSISCDSERVGYMTAAALDGLMAGKKVPAEGLFVPPDGVAKRRSTETLAIEDPNTAAAAQFIRDHLAEAIDVAEVVRHVDVSRRWLEQAFRQSVGCTPHEYLSQVRVERAKRLLVGKRKVSFAEIARQCGFADTRRLHLVFQRVVGVSLEEYRRTHYLGRE